MTFSPDFGTRDRPNFSILRCSGQKLNSDVTLVRVAASVLWYEAKESGYHFSKRVGMRRNGAYMEGSVGRGLKDCHSQTCITVL